MKTIIVAVDFSKWSNYSVKFAIKLANFIESDVEMVWVDKAASMLPDYITPRLSYINEVKRKFEVLVNKNNGKLNKGRLEYKIRKGKVYKEVVNQAVYSDAYMIIAGTHGTSGFEEQWIGSNAYKMVASAKCPVITIRNGYCFLEPASRILLPIDSTIETRQKVPFTAELAKTLGAEICVLSLYPSSVKEVMDSVNSYSKQVNQYLNEANVRFTFDAVKADGNIANTIINYAKEYKFDLISIMTEQETAAANFFLGTYAQQIVNHSPIPVLSIRSQGLFDIATR